MKKVLEISLVVVFVVLFLPALNVNLLGIQSIYKIYDKATDLTASVFFTDSVTEASLKNTYANVKYKKPRVRILIVPGHDPESPGTEFKGLKEATLNLELGEELYRLFQKKPLFDIYISQTVNGYNPMILSYLESSRDAINKFVTEHKNTMQYFVNRGEVKRVSGVIHNNATSETAFKLFGINKWANDNGMNIVIHIHFNDYPGRRKTSPGKYSGFTIYVPENQYSNAKGSKSVAESIQKRLATLYPESDLPIEDNGVVPDQDLIALGSNNTLDGAGILIEYGYIYEPAFNDPAARSVIIKDLALQTYLGIMDFFEVTTDEGGPHSTRLVPHDWQSDLGTGQKEGGVQGSKISSVDVMSLQAALTLETVYPPAGKTKNDCYLTGTFGPCTKKSVQAFQEKYGILPAEGFVGEKTRAKLNELY